MTISKTPLRMSFVGGGSDLPAFYREYGGAVVSTAVNKYVYIVVNNKFDGKIRISYNRTEEAETVDKIEHPLVRHALEMTGIRGGVEIASLADIPSKGSGLGSSSSFTVGLLNALNAFSGKRVSKKDLAEGACEIELQRCAQPIGKQDQYAAAFGGLNLIKFHPDDSVTVEPIVCSMDKIAKLESSIIVFYTGRTRSASELLAKQSKSIITATSKNIVRRMVDLTHVLKAEIENGGLDQLGAILDENWNLKKQLQSGISDDQIDKWYSRGIKAGALGGKVLGAGNGGFIMFFADPQSHDKIISSLAELRSFNFKFDLAGSEILHSDCAV